jgi:hypothetical protein
MVYPCSNFEHLLFQYKFELLGYTWYTFQKKVIPGISQNVPNVKIFKLA